MPRMRPRRVHRLAGIVDGDDPGGDRDGGTSRRYQLAEVERQHGLRRRPRKRRGLPDDAANHGSGGYDEARRGRVDREHGGYRVAGARLRARDSRSSTAPEGGIRPGEEPTAVRSAGRGDETASEPQPPPTAGRAQEMRARARSSFAKAMATGYFKPASTLRASLSSTRSSSAPFHCVRRALGQLSGAIRAPEARVDFGQSDLGVERLFLALAPVVLAREHAPRTASRLRRARPAPEEPHGERIERAHVRINDVRGFEELDALGRASFSELDFALHDVEVRAFRLGVPVDRRRGGRVAGRFGHQAERGSRLCHPARPRLLLPEAAEPFRRQRGAWREPVHGVELHGGRLRHSLCAVGARQEQAIPKLADQRVVGMVDDDRLLEVIDASAVATAICLEQPERPVPRAWLLLDFSASIRAKCAAARSRSPRRMSTNPYS